MEYYNHLLVAYATRKQIAEKPVFIHLLGKYMSSLIFSRVFLHATRIGQKFAMHRNSHKTLGLRMNLYSWYQNVEYEAIRDISLERSNRHVPAR